MAATNTPNTIYLFFILSPLDEVLCCFISENLAYGKRYLLLGIDCVVKLFVLFGFTET